ncbi:hypothetical protein J2T10_000763 [Paenarthrobacter nicotinovorans]|uniref:Uncharacterized protein n=1 Tax=Paenarthrobacter nicotinovorans TaxID=29320 RepID=A0ABT9TIQ6_PAENI|nr:hypothetical protein [Paenarthrobacter nicotinovorans]MDQ0101144.1 hypothetical protein [Paenarthrobacter nicotinovorans]
MSEAVAAENILDAAHAAIPGYDAAAHVVAISERWLREKQSTFVPAVDAESELQAAAESGGDFPTGLGERINGVAAAVAGRNTELTHLKNFVVGAKERLVGVVKDGTDDGLDFLDDQLAMVLEAIRGRQTAFRNLPSYEEIAAGNDQDALRMRSQLQELTGRYVAIRSAQATLVREALAHEYGDNGYRFLLMGGQIADMIDHEHYFTERRGTFWNEQERDWGLALIPWREATPSPVIRAAEWKSPVPAGPEAQMQFVLRVSTEAEPWVPRLKTMLDSVELAERATSTPSRQGEAPHIAALLELQDLTGWKSPETPAPMKPRPVEGKLDPQTRMFRARAALRERLNS